MSELDEYIGQLGGLPFDKAAFGDSEAQRDIAMGFFIAGRDGLMPSGEALGIALALGRMAAYHGGRDACFNLALFLGAHAERADDAEMRKIRAAEAVAWLHRAAEAGHAEADRKIAEMADDGELATVLAAATRMEKRL